MYDDWPFEDPKNVAVITLKRIMAGQTPILLVTHDSDDGMWQFLDGEAASTDDAMIVGLGRITKLDPSIFELADLPLGWRASRPHLGAAWSRRPK